MKITRLYTGDDNESRFEDIALFLEDRESIGMLSPPAAGWKHHLPGNRL